MAWEREHFSKEMMHHGFEEAFDLAVHLDARLLHRCRRLSLYAEVGRDDIDSRHPWITTPHEESVKAKQEGTQSV